MRPSKSISKKPLATDKKSDPVRVNINPESMLIRKRDDSDGSASVYIRKRTTL